ncbi:MAG: hypothetical protein G01um101438_871 [Parcubacteria group bacterium Gr01-1014_38]|nr:MAG: hypothetical protein G01um101438_871 [Parcubacteria group bacterium Gr01-1014_38]
MHSTQEYCAVIFQMLRAAQDVAERVRQDTGDTEPREILLFCIRHGYIGYPLSQEKFDCGGWLSPAKSLGGPRTMEEVQRALAIVVCFQGDPVPCVGDAVICQKGALTVSYGGFVSRENRLLVITDADLLSPFDLAIEFLHEARHARQHFGEPFEKLAPLDPPELHETRTWEFHLQLLDGCGGDAWREATKQEAEWLAIQLTIAGRQPGDPYFAMSNVYHPALDTVFGALPSEQARQHRNLLVAMRALFLLAEKAGVPDEVAHRTIVDRFHAWAHEQSP